MTYEVLERVALPVVERHDGDGRPVFSGETTPKEAGSTITDAEFKKHGQTAADVANLVKSKAIKKAS